MKKKIKTLKQLVEIAKEVQETNSDEELESLIEKAQRTIEIALQEEK